MQEEEVVLAWERLHVHGTTPQFLIEKIMRERIYESLFYKSTCYSLNAHLLITPAENLTCIGGMYGAQKPTEFICLLLKILQIQPEPQIVDLFLDSKFKYLVCLTAIYIRMVYPSAEVYRKLEPLLLDRRKIRFRNIGCSRI